MPQRDQEAAERGHGKVIWDMGSSLYDSYELASVQLMLDSHLAGLPSSDEPLHGGPTGAPPSTDRASSSSSKQKQVVVLGGHRGRGRRKATLRALFRAVASWAIRPRQGRACACAGVVPSSAIEFEPSSHCKP